MTKKQAGRPIDGTKDIAIINAARELLFDKGPEAVTMEGVAAKSGVSKGTMYSRYPNRQQLLKTVIETESNKITLSIGPPPNSRRALKKALLEFVEQVTGFLVSKEHLKLMEVMALPSGTLTDTKRLVYQNGPQQTLETLTIFLTNARNTGLIRSEDPEISAEMLLGMMIGLDLVRAWYQIPLRQKENRKQHTEYIVSSFLALHGCVL